MAAQYGFAQTGRNLFVAAAGRELAR